MKEKKPRAPRQNSSLEGCVKALSPKVKGARAATLVMDTLSAAYEEYSENKKFYKDFVRFNFCNGKKSNKVYKRVNFGDPPAKEKRQIERLYRLFRDCSIGSIYHRLGIVPTTTSMCSPIETKWAFTYFLKYGTLDYDSWNIVTDAEILRRLDNQYLDMYLEMF